jgi:hypothetical protein
MWIDTGPRNRRSVGTLGSDHRRRVRAWTACLHAFRANGMSRPRAAAAEDEAASMLDALLATDLDALTVPHPTREGAQT